MRLQNPLPLLRGQYFPNCSKIGLAALSCLWTFFSIIARRAGSPCDRRQRLARRIPQVKNSEITARLFDDAGRSLRESSERRRIRGPEPASRIELWSRGVSIAAVARAETPTTARPA